MHLMQSSLEISVTPTSDPVGQERLVFKQNVRKLKTLGLTESLEVGYRLSPRGMALLEKLRTGDRDDERKR